MVCAWGGICCSDPACVSISLREATYTYSNIIERKAFTVNIPSEKYIKEVDYCGIVSGKSEDKFVSTGLTR
jgi:flavin reductase (DIM6/NTAB) family NADH-FMN oxidoreductase RutF